MRWTRTLLAAALALGAVPAIAHGSGGADGVTPGRRAEWLAERARLAEGLPGAARYAAAVDDWGWYAELMDAGDLDGDGKGDLVDLRSHLTYDDRAGLIEQVRLDAYRGTDGTALWSRTLPPASFVFPLMTKTGVDGKAGFLTLAFTEAAADTPATGTSGYDTTLASYNGLGVPLWVRPLDGAWTDSVPGFAYGDHFVQGFFDGVPGGGTDVLIQSSLMAAVHDPVGAVYESAAATQLGIVDGATGAVVPLGQPLTTDLWGVEAIPAGDLDKDKRPDVVVALDAENGRELRGVSTADGRTLWTTPGGSDMASYTVLPDVTGDGAADFGTVGFGSGGIDVIPVGTASSSSPFGGTSVTLYDGATGKLRWRKGGSRLFVLGDVDRRPGAEVAVGESVGAPYFGFTVGAYTASGKRLWSVTRKLRTGGERPDGTSSWGGSSDVHADGVNDIGYAVVATVGKKVKRDEGLVDGRTGRVTRDPKPGMFLTKAALDGRGADAYVRSVRRGVLTFDAWRGDANTRLWSLAVRVPGSYDWTMPTSVDGDKCGDLVLSLADDAFTSVVVSGATGTPLWTLTRTDGDPGKVGKASVVKHKVHRKSC